MLHLYSYDILWYNLYYRKQEDKVSWLLVLENAIKAFKAEKKATAAAVIAASNNPETVEVAEEEDLWFQPLWRNDSGISCCEVCNSNFWLLASKVHCCGW